MRMLALSEESGLPYPEAWARALISQAAYEIGEISVAEKELSASEKFYQQAGNYPYYIFLTSLIKAYFFFGREIEGPGLEVLGKAMKLGRQNGYTYAAMLPRPDVWSLLCAKALGAGIEVEYVQELIRKRRLTPPLPAAEYEDWPWPVRIYTLGRFEVFIDGEQLEFSGKAPRRIILFLKALVACGDGGAAEEQIADILWPDSEGDAAHQSFSISLHRLRQLLRNEQAFQLRDGVLKIDPKICWVDAHAFGELLARAEEGGSDEGERLTEKALKLYRGPFLEETNEPWVISRREKLRNRYLRAVRRQGEHLVGIGQFDLAADLYRKGLETDSLMEELYRLLMKCHQSVGQKAEAIATYERCRKMLRSVLGIEPSRETEAVYRELDK
jgi:DNA-binding SARP family transcriptional activator